MSVRSSLSSKDFIWSKGNKLRQYIDRIEPPDSMVLITTAVIVGVGTGLGAVAFVWLLARIRELAGWVQTVLGDVLGLFLVMGMAGLLVGYIVNRWAREAKGHGVPEVMEAIALRNGRIRPRVAAIKVLASSITIGSGGSAGREGPIVQVGSALGSTIGQLLRLSGERVQTLVACGAAAGIAATFNAPIAGAIFALEVILGKFTTRYFGAVVISAVSAGIVGRAFLSNKPAFTVPAYPFNHLGELPIYLVLGVLSALVAVLFIRVLYRLEGLFDGWQIPPPVKTAIGMLLTASIALLLPGREVLGPGLEFIGEAIAEDFSLPLGLMATLLILKLLATSFTLGAGNSGGVFAPSLFMGAILGGMVGSVAHSLWPDVALNPGAYAIVGMAAVFAGAARAPITAVLIVFEMSNDYKLILPLMFATVLSTFLAEFLFIESIYTLKLKLKGIKLQRGRDLDLMQSVLVREAMTKEPFVVHANMPLNQLGNQFQQTHAHSFPVVDDDFNLVGMVSLRDYERVEDHEENDRQLKVKDIATMGTLLIAYEDERLADAIQRIGIRGVNKMPVVARENPRRITGVIRRRDIVKAYNVALTRRAKGQFEEDSVRLRQVDGTEFIELMIKPDSPAASQKISAMAADLPYDCVLVSIRRHGNVFIPHGDTTLQPGDVVTVFVRRDEEDHLRDCLLGHSLVEKEKAAG